MNFLILLPYRLGSPHWVLICAVLRMEPRALRIARQALPQLSSRRGETRLGREMSRVSAADSTFGKEQIPAPASTQLPDKQTLAATQGTSVCKRA